MCILERNNTNISCNINITKLRYNVYTMLFKSFFCIIEYRQWYFAITCHWYKSPCYNFYLLYKVLAYCQQGYYYCAFNRGIRIKRYGTTNADSHGTCIWIKCVEICEYCNICWGWDPFFSLCMWPLGMYREKVHCSATQNSNLPILKLHCSATQDSNP